MSRKTIELCPFGCDLFHTKEQVAKQLGVSLRTIYKYIDQGLKAGPTGHIHCVNIGAFYSGLSVDEWMKRWAGISEPMAPVVVLLPEVGELFLSRIEPGFVYLFQMDRFFKIGMASDVDIRFRSFATLPIDVTKVHMFASRQMGKVERFLHRKFAQCRYRGEWFELSGDWVEWICSIRDYEMDAVVMGYKSARIT
jgi:hypothetical protein